MISMTPSLRKLVLTLHVITTVGWLGSAAAYIPITLYVSAVSTNPDALSAILGVMASIAWYVLVPMSFASLLTGIVMSLGTQWGLFRHYWILFKLLINLFACFVLFDYTQGVSRKATEAANGTLTKVPSGDIVHASFGLLVLIVAAVLAVYKPKGMTRYGWRKQQQNTQASIPYTTPRWVNVMQNIMGMKMA